MKAGLRLRKAPDFARVYGARAGKAGGLIVLHSRANSVGHPRVGFSVSTKVGSAVVRNRVRRHLRVAATVVIGDTDAALDFVVVARPPAATASLDDLTAELRRLFDAVPRPAQV